MAVKNDLLNRKELYEGNSGTVKPKTEYPTYQAGVYGSNYNPTELSHGYQNKQFGFNYNPGQIAYDKIGSSPYDDAASEVINSIKNRQPFQYDVTGDALYQQYKNQYLTQGKMAMTDAMAQASAMTGGYGNSYAAQVGNQAYQSSVQQLNNVIPELYQLAYDRYNQETQDLYNQYGLYDNERTNWQNLQQTNWQNKLDAFKTNEGNMQFLAQGQLQADELTDQSDWRKNSLDLDVQKANEANKLSAEEMRYKWESLSADEKWRAYNSTIDKIKAENEQKAANDDDGEVEPTETANTKAFIKEFSKVTPNMGNASQYLKYMDEKIGSWFEAGKLSEAEVKALWKHYGISK